MAFESGRGGSVTDGIADETRDEDGGGAVGREAGTAGRGRRRSREERGLPDAQARLDLATTYLEVQHARWPELAACGELPPVSDETVAGLAEEFRRRFLDLDPVGVDYVMPGIATLGGAYVRYSDESSNSRSLAQQLRNVLERAARDRVFIPWAFVFADAAVTGTTAARRGYRMAKEAVRHQGGLETLYVDELGRANRDGIETLKLGRLIARLRKRMVGATDGFDSTTPHAGMMLSVFGMLNEHFSEQLRAKVGRGMRDAFRRGLNVRPPSFGYRLVPAVDAEGRPLLDRHGDPAKVKAVDPDAAPWVEEAFRLYAERGRSPERIAKLLNEQAVGGRRAWDRGSVLQLLTRATYAGLEYEGMTRQVRDPETGKVKTEKRPKSEWQRREAPQLRIVSDELFAKTQRLIKERSDAYAPTAAKRKRRSRAAAYPTLLVRPVCGCGAELTLGRSSERHSSFCCPNGSKGKNGCTLRSYKAVSIVTAAVVDWVEENLVTPDLVDVIVGQANAALAEEAARPREDVRPIVREIKATRAKRDRLARVLEDHAGDGVGALVSRLKEHDRNLKRLGRKLRAAKAANAPRPEPFAREQVEAELGDLAGLLGGEVAAAAPVLAALTGPVTVREGKATGRKGTPWVASFAFSPAAALAKAAEARGRSSAAVWKLVAGDAAAAVPVELALDKVPEYESLAPRFKELRDGGATAAAIAAAYGRPRKFVADALKFADAGVRPKGGKSRPAKGRDPSRRKAARYTAVAADVAQMRDVERITWAQILGRLRQAGTAVSEVTARRAYDHAHRAAADALPEVPKGRRRRGRSTRLAPEVDAAVGRLLGEGVPTDEVARLTGCSAATVRRRRESRQTAGRGDA